jgi:hypothetical protein
MLMTRYEPHWVALEEWLTAVFDGQVRKNGTDRMVDHSLRIGQALHQAGEEDITVFGGYCHDVFEDVTSFKVITPAERRARLLPVALAALGDMACATKAVLLAEACSYSDDEYLLTKGDRKTAACARWLASGDIRVLVIKRADVDDNDADCETVSAEFAAGYRSWATPLHAALCERIDALRGVPNAPRVR